MKNNISIGKKIELNNSMTCSVMVVYNNTYVGYIEDIDYRVVVRISNNEIVSKLLETHPKKAA